MGKMSELMLKMLAEINDNLKKYALQTWEDLGLTYSEVMILSITAEAEKFHEPVHKSQLAKRLGLTKAAITQSCNKLEKKGYIENYVADFNMKNHYLRLNDEIRKSIESRCYNMNLCLQHFIDSVGEENIVLLMDLLKEFNNAVLRLSEHRCDSAFMLNGNESQNNFPIFDDNDDK